MTQSTHNTDEELSKLHQKIARQIVALQYPHGKRTNGEMNEDAHFISQSPYVKNIFKLVDEFVTARDAAIEREARLDELETIKKYAGAWFKGNERQVNWINIEIVNDRIAALEATKDKGEE
jgi:hypothetical protein